MNTKEPQVAHWEQDKPLPEGQRFLPPLPIYFFTASVIISQLLSTSLETSVWDDDGEYIIRNRMELDSEDTLSSYLWEASHSLKTIMGIIIPHRNPCKN